MFLSVMMTIMSHHHMNHRLKDSGQNKAAFRQTIKAEIVAFSGIGLIRGPSTHRSLITSLNRSRLSKTTTFPVVV
jgi:hypothetical protein